MNIWPQQVGPRRRWAFASGLVAVGLSSLLGGLEDNLGRLYPPASDASGGIHGYGYDALHRGSSVTAAFRIWADGHKTLSAFHPITAQGLISTHVAIDVLFVVAYIAFGYLALTLVGIDDWRRNVVWGVGAVDVVENLFELLSASRPSSRIGAAHVLVALYWIKWIVVGLLVGAAFIHCIPKIRAAFAYLFDAPASARVVLAAASGFVALFFFGSIGLQADDVVQTWLENHPLQAVLSVVFYAAYVGVVRLLRRMPASVGGAASATATLGVGVVLAAVGAAVWKLGFGGGSSIFVLGALVGFIGIGSVVAGNPGSPQKPENDGRNVLVVAAVLPAVGIGLVAVRLLSSEIATHGRWELTALVAAAWLGAALVVGLVLTLGSGAQALSKWWAVPLVLPLVIGAALECFGVADDVGAWMGMMASLLALLGIAAAAGGAVRLTMSDVDAPAALRALHFRRTPVVTLLLVWFLIAASFDGRNSSLDYHDVRTVGYDRFSGTPVACAAGFPTAVGVDEALRQRFCGWVDRNAKDQPGKTVPLLLVTASGGGIRAAGWTARALDCLLLRAPKPDVTDPCGEARTSRSVDRWQYVFAAGGASGGSVGIASVVAEELTRSPDAPPENDWVNARFDHDSLAAMMGQLALGELEAGAFGIYAGSDRQSALEDGWARRWGTVDSSACPDLENQAIVAVGFRTVSDACPGRAPLMLLNGTNVADGKRVDISPMRSFGDRHDYAEDLISHLCANTDVPLFSAAFMSGRFPFVSPSGRLPGHDDEKCAQPDKGELDVVDGGYRDNSGSSQVNEMWEQLAPLVAAYDADIPSGYTAIRPVLFEIDNSESPFGVSQTGSTAAQILRPVLTVTHLIGDRGTESLADLKAAIARFDAGPGDKGVAIRAKLAEHPGGRLPLGWLLSRATLHDLDGQVTLAPTVEEAKRLEGLWPQ